MLASGSMWPHATANGKREPSVLEDFEAEGVLHALDFGIIVLDEQLCPIYTNGIAQRRLALQLREIRAQPLADLLPQPQRFVRAARLVLESGVTLDYTLRVNRQRSPDGKHSFAVRIVPLRNQTMEPCALIEWMA